MRLYLIRHAKSSWDFPGLSDHDRPLNKRGKKDAPMMAKILKKQNIKPDVILSSSAVRAYDYAKVIAEEFGIRKNQIEVTKKLYMADEEDMLDIIRSLKKSNQTVFLIGHNPDLTDFANSLTNERIDNIPTSGIFAVEFDAESWKDADFGKGKFISFDYPKKHY